LNILKILFKSFYNLLFFIVLLEPLWMLLPFAVFLYGSFFKLNFFYENYLTAWLVYHILPSVKILWPIAFFLIFYGTVLFIIGFIQIYLSKILKKGLIKNGLYKFLRHPQYTGLILFSIGFILIWGRFITFILFTIMLFIYYYLIKKEEEKCLKEFGNEYKEYIKKTFFLFPTEKYFNPRKNQIKNLIKNKYIKRIFAFIFINIFIIIICFFILFIRFLNFKNTVYLKTYVNIDSNKKCQLISITGNSTKKSKNNKIADILKSISNSDKFKNVLRNFDLKIINTLVIFPVHRTIREKKNYYNEGKIDFYVVLSNTNLKLEDKNFNLFLKSLNIIGALQLNKVDCYNSPNIEDIILGNIEIILPNYNENKDIFKKTIKSYLLGFLYGSRTSGEGPVHFFLKIIKKKKYLGCYQ